MNPIVGVVETLLCVAFLVSGASQLAKGINLQTVGVAAITFAIGLYLGQKALQNFKGEDPRK